MRYGEARARENHRNRADGASLERARGGRVRAADGAEQPQNNAPVRAAKFEDELRTRGAGGFAASCCGSAGRRSPRARRQLIGNLGEPGFARGQ